LIIFSVLLTIFLYLLYCNISMFEPNCLHSNIYIFFLIALFVGRKWHKNIPTGFKSLVVGLLNNVSITLKECSTVLCHYSITAPRNPEDSLYAERSTFVHV